MTVDFDKVYTQYKADQQDGFVSNIDVYIRSTYKHLSEHRLNKLIFKLKKTIRDDNFSKHPTIR